jgi:hypothetical protein
LNIIPSADVCSGACYEDGAEDEEQDFGVMNVWIAGEGLAGMDVSVGIELWYDYFE